MNVLLSLLHSSPEYESLRAMLDAGQTAAVSGVSQIARAHWIAALHEDTGRPVVAVCQDEMAASSLAAELTAFLGQPPVTLPSRELTFLDAAGVSREWEQRRLRILYDLSAGRIPVLVTTLEALQLRTIPKSTLYAASIRLTAGGSYDLDKLTEQLTAAGYTRASLVEGAGQFALRGGILDVFSPAHDQPVRAEFFGDELDAMGFFDPVTQRRTENCDEALLLPTQEALPGLHPGGLSGLCADLQAHIARQNRRKTPNQALIKTLESDCEKLENGVSFSAADRYLALIYPQFACAADYISQDAAVFFCDHGNLQRGGCGSVGLVRNKKCRGQSIQYLQSAGGGLAGVKHRVAASRVDCAKHGSKGGNGFFQVKCHRAARHRAGRQKAAGAAGRVGQLCPGTVCLVIPHSGGIRVAGGRGFKPVQNVCLHRKLFS